ncbi:MAG: tRNA threonylcarbamoyladenosine biosynthesis protein TsaE [Actinomycetota bacterium]|nr:tRNA threonylcarbamoyladenosine biosynthesis protein TsaE [Actinomycetota bacterium]
MKTVRTTGVDQTRALGAAVASLAHAGDLLLLAGDLGTGKTAFAQGFARGLGVTDQVVSPTFTLARQYEGSTLRLNHLDVYRLDHLQEAVDLGISELIDDDCGVTLIEWGDVVIPALPADFLEVRLAYGFDDDERLLSMRPVGTGWSARRHALDEVLTPWQQG